LDLTSKTSDVVGDICFFFDSAGRIKKKFHSALAVFLNVLITLTKLFERGGSHAGGIKIDSKY
jgi:hypothetical protein